MAGPFPYNATIPQATDQISQSQPLILENFGSINQLIGVDHATFASANAGWHNKVTFPVQSPEPTFSAGYVGLFNFLSPTTANNQLYFTDNAGNKRILTLRKDVSPTSGYTLLPGNIFVGWSDLSTNASGNGTVTTFAALSFPTISTILYFDVAANAGVADRYIQVVNASATTFTVKSYVFSTATPVAMGYRMIVVATLVDSSLL